MHAVWVSVAQRLAVCPSRLSTLQSVSMHTGARNDWVGKGGGDGVGGGGDRDGRGVGMRVKCVWGVWRV